MKEIFIFLAFISCNIISGQALDSIWMDNQVYSGNIYRIYFDTIKIKNKKGKYSIPANDMDKIVFRDQLQTKHGIKILQCENVKNACKAGKTEAKNVRIQNYIGSGIPTLFLGIIGGGVAIIFDKYPSNYKSVRNSKSYKRYQENFFYNQCFRDQVQKYRHKGILYPLIARLTFFTFTFSVGLF